MLFNINKNSVDIVFHAVNNLNIKTSALYGKNFFTYLRNIFINIFTIEVVLNLFN